MIPKHIQSSYLFAHAKFVKFKYDKIGIINDQSNYEIYDGLTNNIEESNCQTCIERREEDDKMVE